MKLDRGKREWIALVALFAGVFVTLALLSRGPTGKLSWNYLTGVLVVVAIYALFSLGLSLEFGSAGLSNFGHAAFLGIGAYSVAIFTMRYGDRVQGAVIGGAFGAMFLAVLIGLVVAITLVPLLQRALPLHPRASTALGFGIASVVVVAATFALSPISEIGAQWVAVAIGLLIGMVLAALAGLLLGIPGLRLREDYLAIVTIGAAEILRSVWVNEEQWTGGTLGINRLTRPLVDWSLETPAWRAFVVETLGQPPAFRVTLVLALAALVALAFAFIVVELLQRSPWGRTLRAIRDDEAVAASLGKNVLWYKLQALMIGSAIASVAGVILSWHLSVIYPEHFVPLITFNAWIILVLGGVGNHKGAVAGAILLWGIYEIAGHLTLLEKVGIRDLAGPPQAILIGLLLVLVMMFRPQGALGRKEEMLFGK